MRTRTADTLFYISLGITPIGIVLRISDIFGGNILFTLGLLGLLTYFAASIIRGILKKDNNKIGIVLKSLIVVIIPIIFAKYLYYNFGDYLGLVIIPIFLISTIIYLISELKKNIKVTSTSILICLLIIPLFNIDFNKDPRNYIPLMWYNRYNVERAIEVKLPYNFKFHKTESLSIKAFEAQKQKEFILSISLYKQAIKIEPDNPRLHFGISECYACTNDLELAKNELDTAIHLDDNNPFFYNNRGLLYYKLNENSNAILDFKKAIEIDSTQYSFFCNLALVFNSTMEYDEACKMIDKAEELGANINQYKLLKRIRKKHN
ncbi:MAG: tetratricopeptide repeat protein [Bacteroidales bacterium]